MLSERYGIVIGLNQYQDPNIPALKYAERDALEIYSFLINQGGFPASNVKLLLGKDATYSHIRRAFSSFLHKQVHEEDMVFIYFAGYGGAEKDPLQLYEDGWAKYLLPYDSLYDDFYATALDVQELARYIKSLTSSDVYLFLDCSFKGGPSSRSIVSSASGEKIFFEDLFVESFLSKKGRNVYMASDPDQGAFEEEKFGHGLFTYCLLEGLKGKAVGSSGWVSPESLVEHLRHKVRKESQKLGRNQKVYLRGDPNAKTKFLPPASHGRPKIQFQNPRLIDKENVFEITSLPYFIGSSLSSHLQTECSSSLHSIIVSAGEKSWKIISLSSEPLVINGVPLHEKILFDRDEIQLGKKNFVFMNGSYFSSIDSSEKLLSENEVLSALQITQQELAQLIRSKQITSVQQKGTFYFEADKVAKLKATREVQPTMDLMGSIDELRKEKLLPSKEEKKSEKETPPSSPGSPTSAEKPSPPAGAVYDKKEERYGVYWKEKGKSGEMEILQPKGAITTQGLNFLEEILSQSKGTLILDFSSVVWINPKGMEVLEKGANRKLQAKQKILFCGVKDRIEPHLAEIEVFKNIPRFSSLEEARANA